MKQEAITTIILAIFASTGFWSVIQSFVSNRSKSKTSEQKLILGLAFVQIVEKCEYYIKRGFIDTEEYKELSHYLFEPYAALGGDGTAQRLIKEVERLPIKREAQNE